MVFTAISEERASDPWFKIVDFLQHNWAVIIEQGNSALVVFYGDTRGVFDEISFESADQASDALVRNGFSKYNERGEASGFISLPRGDFHEQEHPNGRIYSNGRYWR